MCAVPVSSRAVAQAAVAMVVVLMVMTTVLLPLVLLINGVEGRRKNNDNKNYNKLCAEVHLPL